MLLESSFVLRSRTNTIEGMAELLPEVNDKVLDIQQYTARLIDNNTVTGNMNDDNQILLDQINVRIQGMEKWSVTISIIIKSLIYRNTICVIKKVDLYR